jgi:hypothetical protein
MNDTVIISCEFSFMCMAQLCIGSLVVPYSAQTIKMLSPKVLCSLNFSEADFTSAECICLNRILLSVQHPHIHIQHQNLQNLTSLSFLWVPRHRLLHVQIIFVSWKQLKPIPHFPLWQPQHFQARSPPLSLAVLTNMLVVKNSRISAFKLLPQIVKQGILY